MTGYKVSFLKTLSFLIQVTLGVPQGGHFGPVLFILFFNGLPLVLTRLHVLMYADDVRMCQQHNEPAQSDLDAF